MLSEERNSLFAGEEAMLISVYDLNDNGCNTLEEISYRANER